MIIQHESPRSSEIRARAASVIAGLVILAAVVCLAWLGMSRVSPDAARVWALVATLLLPAALAGGIRYGQAEARGAVAGIARGMETTQATAKTMADVVTKVVPRAREVAALPSPGAAYQLPVQVIDITDGQLNGGNRVVELGQRGD